MPTMSYTVTGRDTIFNGENDFEDMRKDPLCRYESDNREESLEAGNDEVVSCEVKIFRNH